jgi:uncharacterized protein
MRIEVDKLEKSGNFFAHVYEPEEIVLDEEHARIIEPPQVEGSITRKGSEYTLRGKVTARAQVDCDRCLKAVDVPVESEFEAAYVPQVEYALSETAELHAEDMAQSVFSENAIDVDELVREQIMLSLPSRALCGEECKGLCPVCGGDRNLEDCGCQTKEVDPRWAALAALKKDQD